MASLASQTNINTTRYFFATTDAGEQTLNTSTQASGNFTDFYVGISGPQGNSVQINQMPDVIGTVTAGGEEMVYAGTASTYKTLSSLSQTATGISLSTDRIPGSGTTTIEAYCSNGPNKGFEFLTRGVNSELVSTINVATNVYLSTIGRPGATGVLGGNGTFITGGFIGSGFNSLDYQTGGGGRTSYIISDLSGASGITPQQRWAIGTVTPPTGGNTGSDFTLYSYADDGSFITSPLAIKRSDGSMGIGNLSTINATSGTAAPGRVFPIIKDNTEFGIPGAGNSAVITSNLTVLFSTPVANLNPNYQTLLNINWANAVSTSAKAINFKVGFSTATAYTNVLQTSYVPGGGWTPGGAPGDIGNTNICCVLDPDGLSASGTGFLYVAAQTTDGSSDQLYLDKGPVTEPTRNALTYRSI